MTTSTNAATAPMIASPSSPCADPKAMTMKTTSRPSNRTPLKATVNPYQSRPAFFVCEAPAARSRSARKASSSSWSGLKPLERRIAFRSHCRPNVSSSAPTTRRRALIGHRVEGRAENGHERAEDHGGDRGSRQRRPPSAHDTDAEHDRERLDHLHGTGEKRAQRDQNRVRAQRDPAVAPQSLIPELRRRARASRIARAPSR